MSSARTQLIENKRTNTPTLFDVDVPSQQTNVFFVQSPILEQSISKNHASIEKALKSIFPTQQEESKLQKSRRILGEVAKNITDEELERYLTDFQYLLDSWLDDYEKQVFNNKTLSQLLKEGQNGSISCR